MVSERVAKNRSKTIERLIKMKKQFRFEMDEFDTEKKSSAEFSLEERKFPIKPRSKKVEIRMESKKSEASSKDFLQKIKQKHKYCLVCEEIIMDSVIDFHERECQPLQ